MTIRLLAQYQGNPPNTIVTLAGGVETALVAAGNATTDLSGGVPPVYVTPANSQIGDVLYGPDGVPLGVADPTGKLLMNFNGITAPGAPTGLTLTPIAGGVLAAFTPSVTLGGTVGTGYEVTLSNGRVQRGAGSPIVINSPAGAVTATVKQINGAGLSVASAASTSATVTAYTAPTIPGAPTGLALTAGNGKVTATWTAAASNGSALRDTIVTLSNGASAVALGTTTTVDVPTPNGIAVTATARANNGEGAGPTSVVSNSVTPTAAAPAFVDVVIFAGQSQSNSNGTTGSDVPAALQGAMTDAYTWDPFGKTFQTYQAGVTSALHLKGGKYPDLTTNYWGMEAEYLRLWREQNPGVPIYLIKKGHSTTSIDQAARTANRGCWDPALTGVNSDLFEELVAWVADAYAAIRAMGKTPRLRGFNWIQGENEAGFSGTANAYQTTLTNFIASVRSRVEGTATAPFIVSRIQTSSWAFPAPVRAAQEAVASAVSNVRWFDADGATVAADNVHYNPAGCQMLGRRCYAAGMTGAEIVTRYVSRMTVAPSGGRITALTTMFDSLATKSVWPTITAMQLYASHDQQSALVSAGYVAATGIPTNETFVADQGFTGSGTGSHIDTGYSLATTDPRYVATNNSQSVWVRSKPNDTGIDIGCFTGGATILALVVGSTAIRVNAASDVGNIVTAITKRTGLNTVARLGSADSRLYQDGVQLGASATSPVGAIPTGNVWVGDRSGGSSAPTTAQYAAFLAGSSRTAQQEADLYATLNTYLQSIGAA